jgi:hypothetical protein
METACASALAAMHGGATAVRGAGFAEAVVHDWWVPSLRLGGSVEEIRALRSSSSDVSAVQMSSIHSL